MLLMQPYYEKRKQDMLRLRDEEMWSLQMIADKYNISRARVGQILGTKNNKHNSKITRKLKEHGIDITLTNKQMAELFDCSIATVTNLRRGMRHASEKGAVHNGMIWEEWASRKLFQHGIRNSLTPFRTPYDILTSDNVRVEVLVAITEGHSPSLKNISPVWKFGIRKRKMPNRCDFYMLIVGKTEDVYIIPYDKVPNCDTMAFCSPTTRPLLFKWGRYHNAYHLLKP